MLRFLKKLGKTADLCLIGLIFLLLVAGLVRTLFFPKEHNNYENRYSNQVLPLSLSSFLDHSFQDSIEDALADQIPKAETLKKTYNTFSANLIDPMIRAISASNPSRYINFRSMKLFGDHIVYECRDLGAFQPRLDPKIANYNAVIARNPGVDFYAYFIEKDTDINFETGRKLQAGAYVCDRLDTPAEQEGVFEVNSYDVFRSDFYQTDHHWNHVGAYRAYLHLHEILGCQDPALTVQGEQKVNGSFSGSKARSLGATTFHEEFSAYLFDYPSLTVTLNGQPVADYGAQQEMLKAQQVENLSYGGFYGSDAGEIIFDSGREELENILIIGESFDNAILKLLASHFHRTFSIDLRNYEHFMGSSFDIDQYIRENGIDRVLFIGNLDFYLSEDFMLG